MFEELKKKYNIQSTGTFDALKNKVATPGYQHSQQAIASGKASPIVKPAAPLSNTSYLSIPKKQALQTIAEEQNVKAGGQRQVSGPLESIVRIGGGIVTDVGNKFLGDVSDFISPAVSKQSQYKIGETIGDIARPAINAVVKPAVQKLSQTPIGKAYTGLTPETKETIGAALSLPTPALAARGAVVAGKTGLNLAGQGAEIVGKNIPSPSQISNKIGETAQNAVQKRIDQNVFQGNKTTRNLFEDTKSAGADVSKVVKDRQLKIKTDSDGNVITDEATKALDNEITQKATQHSRDLEAYSNQGVGVSRKQWLDEIEGNLGRMARDPEIQRKLLEARNLIEGYFQRYAGPDGNIPLLKVNELKSELYNNSTLYSKSGSPDYTKAGGNEIAARGAKFAVEKSIPDVRVAQINKEIGELLESKAFLEKLNGNKLKGGRLGKTTSSLAGAAVGGALGSLSPGFGTAAGIVGGGLAGNALSKLGFSRQLGGTLTKQFAKLKQAGVLSPTDRQLSDFLEANPEGKLSKTLDTEATKRLFDLMLNDRNTPKLE